MSDDIESDLKRFILEELIVDRHVVELEQDQPLLTGLLDSFAMMSLVTLVEERYGVTVDIQDVSAENFGTVRALADFVRARRKHPILPADPRVD